MDDAAFCAGLQSALQHLGGQAEGIALGLELKNRHVFFIPKLQAQVRRLLGHAVEVLPSPRDPRQQLYRLKRPAPARAPAAEVAAAPALARAPAPAGAAAPPPPSRLAAAMQRLCLEPSGGGGGGGGARAAPAVHTEALPQPPEVSYEHLARAAAPAAPAGAAAAAAAQPGSALDEALEALLAGDGGGGGGALEAGGLGAGCTLATRAGGAAAMREASLLGVAAEGGERVYLNVHEPFCAVMLGVQGAGKSHTLACLVEACLLPLRSDGLTPLRAPMMALVLHFDQSAGSVCEATGLIERNPALAAAGPPALAREDMTVLVSPSFYKQRKAFYGGYCTVKPLLLSWATLTADSIKRIMRIAEDDNQLYVATLLSVLRDSQRAGVLPHFNDFLAQVRDKCGVKGQSAPLDQRLALLEDVVRESAKNAALAAEFPGGGGEVRSACAPGKLVVVDLTNPLLSASEANGIFSVLVEQFRALPTRCGKVLALDEAHKYMDGASEADDALSRSIVNCARLMRHDGLRLLVSTQSPLALAPELLELTSLAVLHRFHSADWLTFLSKKLPLAAGTFERVRALQPGAGLVYASRAALQPGAQPDSALLQVRVRQRLSADRGSTRAHE